MLNYIKKKGNLIHKTAIINWKKLSIGKNNVIGPYVVIGNFAQHPRSKSRGIIEIGNNNFFNEYCNIHLPTKIRSKTIIGNNNYLMNSTTIDHDCVIEDNIVLSSNVILGGNVYIMNGAQLGIKVCVHQNQVIGSYSMIGMNSFITKKIKVIPGYKFYGKPAKKKTKNLLGLKRNKIDNLKIIHENNRFKKLVIQMIK
jgi:UDP-N-acetylglucosamine acyltransferase